MPGDEDGARTMKPAVGRLVPTSCNVINEKGPYTKPVTRMDLVTLSPPAGPLIPTNPSH